MIEVPPIEPRGLRLDNPLNLVRSDIPWLGGSPGSDSRFETFDSAFDGIRAGAMVLISYRIKHGLKTIPEYINRFAPSTENDTQAYAANIMKWLNIEDPDEPYDVTNLIDLGLLVAAIIHEEQGYDPFLTSLIDDACGAALHSCGLDPTQPTTAV